jgi:uracil-DNA glycosylase
VVCMGTTAAQSVLGKPVLITKERGKFIDSSLGLLTFITIHPSAIYRQREKDQYRRFAEELEACLPQTAQFNA